MKIDSIEVLKRLKIGVLGLSVEGLATARFLMAHGISFEACDQKAELKFDNSVDAGTFAAIQNKRLGKGYLDQADQYDMLIRTPGMPFDHPVILKAKACGAVVTSHIQLFFNLFPGVIVGVTGTKGKGTTTTLIGEILKADGRSVFVGGNVGIPPLQFVDQANHESIAVLELSSFQLQDLDVSPHIAVVLNVTADHLSPQHQDFPNYHHSIDDYHDAKKNIVRYQDKQDFTVVNVDYAVSKSFMYETQAQIWSFSLLQKLERGVYLQDQMLVLSQARESNEPVIGVNEMLICGRHNLENAAAAISVGAILGVPKTVMQNAAAHFKGLEHRLEYVREVENVRYYNDSFSTAPVSTLAALSSFDAPSVFILGGSEKGIDYSDMAGAFAKSQVRAVILIGTIAQKLKDLLLQSGFKGQIVMGLDKMSEIVQKAHDLAHSKDVVVLSPATASYDLFENYKVRGEMFKKSVRLL